MSASLSRPLAPPAPIPGRPLLSARLPRVYSVMDVLQLAFNVAIICGMFYLTLVAGLYVWQRKMIFDTSYGRPDTATAGVPEAEVLSVATADGLRLTAWYAAPADTQMPVILFLHGNSGHIGHRAERMRRLAAVGWGVLLLEYRGFGGNPGAPSEEGLALDAEAGLAALRGRGVPLDRIVIWGESLGSAVAIRLAATHPAAALVLEAPFTSMADMARLRYRVVPVDLLLKDRFDAIGRIGAVAMPLLIMQGGGDTLIPPAMGARVFAAATAADRQFWRAEAAGHNDLADHGAVEAGIDFVSTRLALLSLAAR